jgi:hypothetical protein
MGLGPYPDVGLQHAREKPAALRARKADGVDPLDARAARRAAAKAAVAKAITFKPKAITFKLCAEHYIKAIAHTGLSRWKPAPGTLTRHLLPRSVNHVGLDRNVPGEPVDSHRDPSMSGLQNDAAS